MAAAPCVVWGGHGRETAGLWIRTLFLLWVLRLLARPEMGMVAILRQAWGGSCGRGASTPSHEIDPAVAQNVGLGAFPGRAKNGQDTLRAGRCGLRKKLSCGCLRVTVEFKRA